LSAVFPGEGFPPPLPTADIFFCLSVLPVSRKEGRLLEKVVLRWFSAPGLRGEIRRTRTQRQVEAEWRIASKWRDGYDCPL